MIWPLKVRLKRSAMPLVWGCSMKAQLGVMPQYLTRLVKWSDSYCEPWSMRKARPRATSAAAVQ